MPTVTIVWAMPGDTPVRITVAPISGRLLLSAPGDCQTFESTACTPVDVDHDHFCAIIANRAQ
jgi:hypothetical protein